MTDIGAGKVPILKCFEDSWRFFFANWRLLLPAAALPAVASGLAPLLGSASASVFGLLLASVAGLLANVFFTAAVLRKAVRDDFIAPLGIAFGEDETRLLAVFLCFVLLFTPFAILFGLVFTVMALGRAGLTEAEIEAMAADPEAAERLFSEFLATPLGASLAIVCFVVFAYVGVRLAMVNAAAVGERRIVFFQTWSWSRGNVLRMLAAIVLTTLPVMVVNVFLTELALSLAGPTAPLPVLALASALVALVGSLLSIPTISLGATFYKGLRPPGFVPK
jgi:hypothetical protein